MRILMLSEYFLPHSPGGAEWSVFHLAGALARAGHSVRVVTPDLGRVEQSRAGDIDKRLAASGDAYVIRFPVRVTMGDPPRAFASYVFGNPFFQARFARAARSAAIEHKSEILHAQGYDSFAATHRAARSLGLPCVATVRDYRALCPISICLHDQDRAPVGCGAGDFRGCLRAYNEIYGVEVSGMSRARHDVRRRLEWANRQRAVRAIMNMDGAIFVSRRVFDIYGASRLTPPFSRVIPNLVPMSESTLPPERDGAAREPASPDAAAFRARLGLAGKRVIAFVGRYSIGKGARVLTSAMEIVAAGRDDVVCVVAGNREETRAAPSMLFAGRLPQKDMRALYATAEFVVLPSRWQEPFSRVLLEAAAAARPIVAADAGGNAEAVIDGVTGRLVPRNDAPALADAILAMLELPEDARRAMGERARDHTAAHFGEAAVVPAMEAFYRDVRAGAREDHG
ncbi:glycosyltransferase family 4 protein [bacterium]|nr:glycosyltransferase family 4 protein [bacterium]